MGELGEAWRDFMKRILMLILIVALASVPKVSALAPEVRLRLEPTDVAVGLSF